MNSKGRQQKVGSTGHGEGGRGKTELPISQRPSSHASAAPEKSKGKKKDTC